MLCIFGEGVDVDVQGFLVVMDELVGQGQGCDYDEDYFDVEVEEFCVEQFQCYLEGDVQVE